MATNTKEISFLIKCKARVNTLGQMVRFTKATGLNPKCMEKEFTLFQMEQNLKVFITWEKDMEKE